MTDGKKNLLDTPEKCRQFLKDVRIGPDRVRILFLHQADGIEIPIDLATDEQIIDLVIQIVNGSDRMH